MNDVDILTAVNGVLLNLAVLIAGVFITSLTFLRVNRPDPWPALVARYLMVVSTALFALANAVPLAPGIYFDFRVVPVALMARRHGRLAGLAVAAPIAVYRLLLGGAGAIPALAQLLIIAIFAAPRGTWLNLSATPGISLTRTPWVALVLFAWATLPLFVAFEVADQPFAYAFAAYAALTVLSAIGLILGQLAGQTRLKALAQAHRLRSLAFTDALTGAYNRRQFELDFPRADEACLLLLDLDHFKRVNDTHGHDVGDRVLQAFVTILREATRPGDDVYRLGGEEFVVLLRDCPPTKAVSVAERIRAHVESSLALYAALPGPALTMSGGLVPVGEQALRRADELLYQAKANGRNRVMDDTNAQRIPQWPSG
ncbi:diguanylate cyclase [Deinococcus maricopensis]|uniref:Diguanylate cyclase n=1 Tax=Deinococcus maricopensis (strain DSM 21211 / LMG 22137 / NRRL B-23946 / LB-34) TaxID=709986 RepID=E8U2Z6_DEIML|nr:diguanylate cyclase [Deinococcus maricopensis]ADV65734.1 diguanylate cyclase [Deinococcus maricopensis DSM 21211]